MNSYNSSLNEYRVLNKTQLKLYFQRDDKCEWIFTGPGVRLVTGAGDLCCQLHLVARLVARRPVSTESNHATCKTRQVSHLVLQQPPLPLRYVGQAAARLPHQVGFYGLKGRFSHHQQHVESRNSKKISLLMSFMEVPALTSAVLLKHEATASVPHGRGIPAPRLQPNLSWKPLTPFILGDHS